MLGTECEIDVRSNPDRSGPRLFPRTLMPLSRREPASGALFSHSIFLQRSLSLSLFLSIPRFLCLSLFLSVRLYINLALAYVCVRSLARAPVNFRVKRSTFVFVESFLSFEFLSVFFIVFFFHPHDTLDTWKRTKKENVAKNVRL